jgi:hypothetical protein
MDILFVLRHGYFVDEVVKSKDVTMKIRDQEISFPTSMVGNHPHWWDNYFARFFSEDKQPSDAFDRVTWKDMSVALFHNQEFVGLDIFSDIRVHADSYANQFERLKPQLQIIGG